MWLVTLTDGSQKLRYRVPADQDAYPGTTYDRAMEHHYRRTKTTVFSNRFKLGSIAWEQPDPNAIRAAAYTTPETQARGSR